MKKLLKLRTFALLAMFMFLLFTVTSCMIVPKSGRPGKGNRGKHKGWRSDKGNLQTQSIATPWESFENTSE